MVLWKETKAVNLSFASRTKKVKNDMFGSEELSDGRVSRKNAPSFIYEILYGEPKFLFGRTDSHGQKIWKGISVDEHIPTEALEELDRIGEIELRASCEGSGPERPTFLILRLRGEESIEKIKAFVAGMNAFKNVTCGAERGNMGLYRIGITTTLWYRKDEEKFVNWWLELPLKVHIVLATIDQLLSDN